MMMMSGERREESRATRKPCCANYAISCAKIVYVRWERLAFLLWIALGNNSQHSSLTLICKGDTWHLAGNEIEKLEELF